MAKKVFWIIPGVFIFLYYILVYSLFIKESSPTTYPLLKTRLGTILWSMSAEEDIEREENRFYCYYPSSRAIRLGGEYIIKMAPNVEDCSEWYSALAVSENEKASEKELFR